MENTIGFEYRTLNPNLFCCPDIGASPFWEGVIWTFNAAKLGYNWNIGDGKKI
jgi:hypothetical protein